MAKLGLPAYRREWARRIGRWGVQRRLFARGVIGVVVGAVCAASPFRPGRALARFPASDPVEFSVGPPSGDGSLSAPRIVLDPGHGGSYTGGASYDADGNLVMEKDLTLAIATRAAALLQTAGYAVTLTRTTDANLAGPALLDDLQARVDLANAVGADVFLSIHVNAFPEDPSVRGIATFYCADRPFAPKSQALATAVQGALLDVMHRLDLDPPDAGVVDDADLGGGHQVVIGPPTDHPRSTEMPGALTELMYLTNPTELAALQRDDVQTALAQGIARGIQQFLSD
jgi:N-acetylmuramoyl-L-alanine amidase